MKAGKKRGDYVCDGRHKKINGRRKGSKEKMRQERKRRKRHRRIKQKKEG